jgi:hypothetical protein
VACRKGHWFPYFGSYTHSSNVRGLSSGGLGEAFCLKPYYISWIMTSNPGGFGLWPWLAFERGVSSSQEKLVNFMTPIEEVQASTMAVQLFSNLFGRPTAVA